MASAAAPILASGRRDRAARNDPRLANPEELEDAFYANQTNQAYYPLPAEDQDTRYELPATVPRNPTYVAQEAAIPYHTRNQSAAIDQYDGAAPIPPPRVSSQQQGSPRTPTAPSTAPLETRVAATRQSRQAAPERHDQAGEHQDNNATAAASAARNRRRAPATPEGAQRNAPAAPVREPSEVLNRMVVSDPAEDAERIQERMAEAQPIAVAGSSHNAPEQRRQAEDDEQEVVAARASQRRQEFGKPRNKNIIFGEYMLGQTLGEGEFGKVKLGWKKDGTNQVAIKLIRRESVASNPTRLPKIYREISILRELAHPNIVRLHEMVETERYIGIILEYASGGELFDHILKHRYLRDPQARRLFAQLISGVGYLHKKGIVHRDLKLENLLLDKNQNIIITDFGFANTFDPSDELSDEVEYNLSSKEFVRKFKLDRVDARGMRRGDLMQTSCGSPCYAAPELVVSDSLYTGRKVDVWSCGVILYAMLAGYLPFDDDPNNPEGDNINLLYKYITNTPLTFPEYVTPHARDLLRQILRPDPRHRADLFTVARHSWLDEYAHVVAEITSSTTNLLDLAKNTALPSSNEVSPALGRSASVRDGPSGSNGRSAPGGQSDTASSSGNRRQIVTRHTLQAEYIAPRLETPRDAPGPAQAHAQVQAAAPAPAVVPSAAPVTVAAPVVASKPATTSAAPSNQMPAEVYAPQPSTSKPLPRDPPTLEEDRKKMPPPVRPGRDIPRSVSDSTSAFATANAANQQVARPSTQGSITSASGGPTNTRSDLRLPSRGSYGQPVAPTVAATNVQGRVTQPTKTRGQYNISAPVPHTGNQNSIGQPMTQPMPAPALIQPMKHHRRTSTLTGLSERLFGRSNSVSKKEKEIERPKTNRKYPPTSMKQYPDEARPRMSTESKRSFSILGKKRSSDLESQDPGEKSSRRFSLIPNSLSLKGIMGSQKDDSKPSTPLSASRPATGQLVGSADGLYDNTNYYGEAQPARVNNFSRLPVRQEPIAPMNNDVYGGTGVYGAPGQPQRMHARHQSELPGHAYAQYPDGQDNGSRPSMQQSRGKLQKNKKLNEAFGGQNRMSKAADWVFRRRRHAQADDDR